MNETKLEDTNTTTTFKLYQNLLLQSQFTY